MIRGAAHKVAHLQPQRYKLVPQNPVWREYQLDLDTVCRGCCAQGDTALCSALNTPKMSPCITSVQRLVFQPI